MYVAESVSKRCSYPQKLWTGRPVSVSGWRHAFLLLPSYVVVSTPGLHIYAWRARFRVASRLTYQHLFAALPHTQVNTHTPAAAKKGRTQDVRGHQQSRHHRDVFTVWPTCTSTRRAPWPHRGGSRSTAVACINAKEKSLVSRTGQPATAPGRNEQGKPIPLVFVNIQRKNTK